MPCQISEGIECYMFMCVLTILYLSLCATTSATFRTRLGTNTKGTSLISSPPPSLEKENGAFLA